MGIEDRVAFLSRPESYPDSTRHVETIETHMSWIFLTDSEAWKLKKPSRFDHLDLRSQTARRRNCNEEVRLNRRLAPDVYRGVVPLTAGSIVDDWLVWMRRLPADRMLDCAIEKQIWSNEDVRKVGVVLARHYSTAGPFPITTEDYLEHLTGELQSSREELAKCEKELSRVLIESRINSALRFIDIHPDIFDARVRARKIVEGHGDLRPEHICLEDTPVIIDCLEFNRNLRIVDPVSEMMFLRLECERLGAPAPAEQIFGAYCDDTGDCPPEKLLAFYRTYNAAVRAKVAIWHLHDHSVRNVEKWIARAEQYLEMAA